ncbi:YegP family protein [Gluconobacter wancherniae]|uniref:YegP family protein n=1 Tax=Gluconobacter wancherniae TaxID=1307955 RepID=UPI001B8A9D44|nr:YegP family protein [Gluconobacter wancherniae]MBS1093082.1 YegP family protein [Gluconobacter wancherniae]
MSSKFELYIDHGGEFRFRLKAGNGEIILSSEGYRQKASAVNGIASVHTNAPNDAHYERKISSSGKPMFNLKAANGQIIGTSQLYSSESARDVGIESVKRNTASAVTVDRTH